MTSTSIYTSIDRTPYTYFIRWNDLDINYYGRRTAKGCHPEEFFISYFTSSKYVEDVIAEYGMPDIIKIHKIFADIDSCCHQEYKFLSRLNVAENLRWLNQTNGDLKWNNVGGYKLTEKTLSNMRKPKSESHKQNMRKPKSESHKLSTRTKCFEKTGYYSYLENPAAQQKCKDSYFQNTGYTHNSKNPETIQRRSDSYFEKTGYTNPSKNPEVLSRQFDSYFEKTGYAHPNLNPEVKERQIQSYKDTCSKRTFIKCPHCDVSGKGPAMKRWHFDNCKCKPLPDKFVL